MRLRWSRARLSFSTRAPVLVILPPASPATFNYFPAGQKSAAQTASTVFSLFLLQPNESVVQLRNFSLRLPIGSVTVSMDNSLQFELLSVQ